MFDIPQPTIKTSFIYKEYNLVFEVYAYRKLTQNEIVFEFRKYMRQNRLKNIPQDETITVYVYGYET